jgi:hypothetical protein
VAFAIPFIGPVFNVIDSVIKRIAPEKMSEEDKAKLAADMQVAVMKQDWTEVEAQYRDRADARALAGKDVERGNWFSNILAASVRPVWGYASLIVVAYPYVSGALGWPAVAIDDATKDIIQTVIMFFFGGRIIEKGLAIVKAAK